MNHSINPSSRCRVAGGWTWPPGFPIRIRNRSATFSSQWKPIRAPLRSPETHPVICYQYGEKNWKLRPGWPVRSNVRIRIVWPCRLIGNCNRAGRKSPILGHNRRHVTSLRHNRNRKRVCLLPVLSFWSLRCKRCVGHHFHDSFKKGKRKELWNWSRMRRSFDWKRRWLGSWKRKWQRPSGPSTHNTRTTTTKGTKYLNLPKPKRGIRTPLGRVTKAKSWFCATLDVVGDAICPLAKLNFFFFASLPLSQMLHYSPRLSWPEWRAPTSYYYRRRAIVSPVFFRFFLFIRSDSRSTTTIHPHYVSSREWRIFYSNVFNYWWRIIFLRIFSPFLVEIRMV